MTVGEGEIEQPGYRAEESPADDAVGLIPRFRRITRGLLLSLLIAVMAISLLARIRLLDAPLERDEGEHAYMAQTMLAGNPPWKLAYNMKLPGADAFYFVFLALFGQTATAIRLGLLIVNSATILMVFLLGKRLLGVNAGLAAAAAYGVLSLSQEILGTVAHSTHFVAFWSVVSVLLLLRAGTRTLSLFVAGLAFGITFLMKQPALAFAGFGAVFIVWRMRGARGGMSRVAGLAAYGAGVVLPYGLLCLALWRAGVFGRFWYWTVTLAQAYAGQRDSGQWLAYFRLFAPRILSKDFAVWGMAAAGIAAGVYHRRSRRAATFVGILLIFSFAAVCGGGNFNPNYFIMMLPAVALAAGVGVFAGEENLLEWSAQSGEITRGLLILLPALIFTSGIFSSVAAEAHYFFSMTPYEFARTSWGRNPFPEAIAVSDYIRTHSNEDAQVAVLGSEAEIYFYSRRRAATGYLFVYGLMENHRYANAEQGEVIGEIEAARPEYIVWVSIQTSWLARPTSSQAISAWASSYTRDHYDIVGIVDFPAEQPPLYIWGSDAATYRTAGSDYILVFRRRTT